MRYCLLLICSGYLLAQPIAFPDENLGQALLSRTWEDNGTSRDFDRDGDGTITIEEAQEVTGRVNLGSARIAELTGLEHFIHLEALDVSNNGIESLAALASMTRIDELNFSRNRVSDLTPIGSLTSLQSLNFHSCPVTDIGDLATLIDLRALIMNRTQVHSIQALQGLALLGLSINNCPIEDLTPLQSLTSLTALQMDQLRATDIGWISALVTLETLSAQNNLIGDIGPLTNLTQLRQLYLGGNQISDITALEGLLGLREVDLGRNAIHDLTPLSSNPLEFLTRIGLEYNDLDVQDCSDIINLAERSKALVKYQNQSTSFSDCPADGRESVILVNGPITPPNFVESGQVTLDEDNLLTISLQHPNLDGWDSTNNMQISYVIGLVSEGLPLSSEFVVDDGISFPTQFELGTAPDTAYYVSIRRQVVGEGYEDSDQLSESVLLPGPQRAVGQQIGSSYSQINRWLLHLPRKAGGFDGSVGFTNRFPTLPQTIQVIGFDASGQPFPGAVVNHVIVGRRMDMVLYGDENAVFPIDLQDQISHVGLFEPNDDRQLAISLSYVNLASQSVSTSMEVDLTEGLNGSEFMLVPSSALSDSAKWDGLALMNLRSDTTTIVHLDQAVQTSGGESIVASAYLGAIEPGGKLLYLIDGTAFSDVEGQYFLIRTETADQKIQAIALNGSSAFLAINHNLILLQ